MNEQIGPESGGLEPEPEIPSEGDRFGGSDGRRFLVEKRAGVGGQAEVYRVRDTRLDRLCAAKFSTAHGTRQKQLFLERFERELQLSARINHPHVLQVYDCGEYGAGSTPYVLLEWMDRGDLTGLIDKAKKERKALPLSYIHYYGLSLGAALRAVHVAQIVHRDVKPDNVLIAQDGVAKLTDFGIAKDISPDAMPLTEVGQTMGTLGFMAPEQLAGLPGPQSDIFSYGATLYALLTGRPPPQKKMNSIPIGQVLPEAWDPVPPSFVPFLQLCMASKLEERATDFDQVVEQLKGMRFPPDARSQLQPGELPPLPTGAFITSGPSVEAPSPIQGFEDTRDLEEGMGDTMDLTVMQPADQDVQVGGGATRADTALGHAGPGFDGTSRDTDIGDALPLSQPTGPQATRQFTAAQATGGQNTAAYLEATRSKKGPLWIILGLLVVVGGAAGFFLTQPKGPASDTEISAATRSFEEAMTQGDWTAAIAAASQLSAASAGEPGGKILLAQDALLAGDYTYATSLAKSLAGRKDTIGGSANLVLAAAARLDSAKGYGDAVSAYMRVLDSGSGASQAQKDRAGRALKAACAVVGGTLCAGRVSLAKRDLALFRSLVLLDDGHQREGSEALAQGLNEALEGPVSCLESSVLHRWAKNSALGGALLKSVGEAGRKASRSPEQCGSYR